MGAPATEEVKPIDIRLIKTETQEPPQTAPVEIKKD